MYLCGWFWFGSLLQGLVPPGLEVFLETPLSVLSLRLWLLETKYVLEQWKLPLLYTRLQVGSLPTKTPKMDVVHVNSLKRALFKPVFSS